MFVSRGAGQALLVITTLIASAVHATMHAQSWPQESGRAYIKLSYGSSTASQQYTFDGREKDYADNVSGNSFFDRSIYAYGELGLTNNVTLLAGLPYKRVIVRDAAYRYQTYAFGSAQVGARVGLKPLLGLDEAPLDALAANVMLTIPTGYTRNYLPSAGAGQVDGEMYLSYGRSFYPIDAYAQAGIGYRYRSTIYTFSHAVPCQDGVSKDCFADTQPEYGDEFTFGLDGGYTFKKIVFASLMLRGDWALKAPTVGFSVANPIPTRQRFIKAGGSIAVFPFDGISVNAQLLFTPYGLNTVKSVDLFLGIDYRPKFF
ncbi:MAG: hypothetical protein JST22_16585 [Bacteroidetes bacterium]|nr:hypothetical protein [Bacteroidota bacterium]